MAIPWRTFQGAGCPQLFEVVNPRTGVAKSFRPFGGAHSRFTTGEAEAVRAEIIPLTAEEAAEMDEREVRLELELELELELDA